MGSTKNTNDHFGHSADLLDDDESAADIAAAFDNAADRGVTRPPDVDKHEIVGWLVDAGYQAAAAALAEWDRPARPVEQRLQEALHLLDWVGHYYVIGGQGVARLVCTRHGGRTDLPGLMLDELIDNAACHEIADHGERDR